MAALDAESTHANKSAMLHSVAHGGREAFVPRALAEPDGLPRRAVTSAPRGSSPPTAAASSRGTRTRSPSCGGRRTSARCCFPPSCTCRQACAARCAGTSTR
jgi:hypothetical protein